MHAKHRLCMLFRVLVSLGWYEYEMHLPFRCCNDILSIVHAAALVTVDLIDIVMSSLCDGWIKLLHFGALKTQLCSNRDPNLLRVRPSLDSDFDMRVESTEVLNLGLPNLT